MRGKSPIAISILGYELLVDFDHEPPERATLDYPGSPEDVIINEVWLEVPEDLFSLVEDQIREAVLEYVRDQAERKAEAQLDFPEREREER